MSESNDNNKDGEVSRQGVNRSSVKTRDSSQVKRNPPSCMSQQKSITQTRMVMLMSSVGGFLPIE